MSNQVTIIITGYTASGKSRILYLLKVFLRAWGFKVEYEPNHDHPTELNFDKYMNRDIEGALKTLKERGTTIRLMEQTTTRSVNFYKKK